jgi:membrane protease YdiL (CAAX protease family)
MGIKTPAKLIWLIYPLIIGGLGCFIMFKVAHYLYGDTISNWFVYISASYKSLPADLSPQDRLVYFTIYAVISMIFSPIGEELFYRGVVHHCFSTTWNHRTASIIDSAAFSITHWHILE